MNQLGMQVAFTLPMMLPLVGAATLHETIWFYPSFMIVPGAHYLPFNFLYGMPLFTGLCAALVGAGLGLVLWGPELFSLGGWVTGAVLVVAGIAGRLQVVQELAIATSEVRGS
ncbi:MAG: hypothetical protein Q8W51_07390 [Candidatus Palauibacterales bacterium]|nr:hypothetical protein [Candidatus Palauibacterales bacterium]